MNMWIKIACELQELVMMLDGYDGTKRESAGVRRLYLQKLKRLKEQAIKNSLTESQAG